MVQVMLLDVTFREMNFGMESALITFPWASAKWKPWKSGFFFLHLSSLPNCRMKWEKMNNYTVFTSTRDFLNLIYIWGLLSQQVGKNNIFPSCNLHHRYWYMYNLMASIIWSYQLSLPLAQHYTCFFFPFERLFLDLNHSFHLKSLCSVHRWYSFTLPDPQFPYLPYEKEAVLKYTIMKMREKC